MNPFTVVRRSMASGKKSFYAQFRHPETGERTSLRSIEQLRERLGIRSFTPIKSRYEAVSIAQQAFEKGIVFGGTGIDPLVIDYISQFWDYDHSEYIQRRNREKANSVGRAYANDCKSSFLKHVPNRLPAGLKLSQLKVAHIERVKLAMFQDGFSNSTVNRVLQAFRSPLAEAYRIGVLANNLADRIRNSTPDTKRKEIPTPKEISKLLTFLNKDTNPNTVGRVYFMAIALAVTTGMRQGEIRGLQPEDIEIVSTETALITVCHSFSNVDKKLKTTKGKRQRTVFAPASLCRAMLDYGNQNPYGNGFVFWSPSTKRYPIDGMDLTNFFRGKLVEIGISLAEQDRRNLNFHSLRHYYASVMSNVIGSDETRKLLGHQSIEMTDHYTHEMKDHLLALDEKRQQAIPFEYENEKAGEANEQKETSF